MIEKIYIPTVHRVDDQLTYSVLPDQLKKNVVMVVQAWEREKYKYDCEYLVLPDEEKFHYEYRKCFSETKKYIYEQAGKIKYALIDDDIKFSRRNQKYFGLPSSMEKSKRQSTDQDVVDMFNLFDSWLDNPLVSVCGCAHGEFPPCGKEFRTNSSISSAFWINGAHFHHILKDLDLASTRVAQDVVFLLSLLNRGYGNRVSEEFLFYNKSTVSKTLKSTQWDLTNFDAVYKDHMYIEKMFPGFFKVLYSDDGKRVAGGFRDFGKVKINWSKAYKPQTLKSIWE